MFVVHVLLLSSTEDDDGDGTNMTGRKDNIYIYIYIYVYIQIYLYMITKFQIRHWDQYSNVLVCRPRGDVSEHPQ